MILQSHVITGCSKFKKQIDFQNFNLVILVKFAEGKMSYVHYT